MKEEVTETIGEAPVVREKVCQRPNMTSHSPVSQWFCVNHKNERKVIVSKREIAWTDCG